MANECSHEGSGTSHVSGEGSDATIELNIKTLDSQIYSFQVDKNMPVSVFKEKIANEIGIPVSQQRLIFRGRVLKDEHLLSVYQVENGHTLHVVARQPTQTQPSAGTSSGDTMGNNSNQVNDASAGAPEIALGKYLTVWFLRHLMLGTKGKALFQTSFGYPDDILSTKIIGERQFNKAVDLFMSATKEYSTGKVNYRHVYQNYSEIEVELRGKTKVRTCPAALGPGFAAGTTDGPGMFGFQQGDTEVRTIVSFLKMFTGYSRLH